MKTFSAKTHEVKRDWFVVDAPESVVVRICVHQGQQKTSLDSKGFVVLVLCMYLYETVFIHAG